MLIPFKKADCQMVTIMQSVMKFFQYEAPSETYYLMGNARMLTLAFLDDHVSLFRQGFAYVNDVCYFSGAWDSDFLTLDADGFIEKLNEKWHEWADMQQPMPIIVGLVDSDKISPAFYVLVGYNKENAFYELLTATGEQVLMSETQMKRDHNRYGFATIDVPYNFLVKSQYYRTVEGAGVGILQKAGLTLSQHLKMTQVLEKLDRNAKEENLEALQEELQLLGTRFLGGDVSKSLNRIEYGEALRMAGYESMGEQYQILGQYWEQLLTSQMEQHIVNIPLLRSILDMERQLIKEQKEPV